MQVQLQKQRMEAELLQQQVHTELMRQQLKVLQADHGITRKSPDDHLDNGFSARKSPVDSGYQRGSTIVSLSPPPRHADEGPKPSEYRRSTSTLAAGVYKSPQGVPLSSHVKTRGKGRNSEYVVELKLAGDDSDAEDDANQIVPAKKTAKAGRGVKFNDKVEAYEMEAMTSGERTRSLSPPVMPARVRSASPPLLRKNVSTAQSKADKAANRASMPVTSTVPKAPPIARSISVALPSNSNHDNGEESVVIEAKTLAEELGTVREIRKGRVQWPPPQDDKDKKKEVKIGKILIDEKTDMGDNASVTFSKENQEKVSRMLQAQRDAADGGKVMMVRYHSCSSYNLIT